MKAFILGTHSRLGSDSPVALVPHQVLREIGASMVGFSYEISSRLYVPERRWAYKFTFEDQSLYLDDLPDVCVVKSRDVRVETGSPEHLVKVISRLYDLSEALNKRLDGPVEGIEDLCSYSCITPLSFGSGDLDKMAEYLYNSHILHKFPNFDFDGLRNVIRPLYECGIDMLDVDEEESYIYWPEPCGPIVLTKGFMARH